MDSLAVGAVLGATVALLGRWGWERYKDWQFDQRYGGVFWAAFREQFEKGEAENEMRYCPPAEWNDDYDDESYIS